MTYILNTCLLSRVFERSFALPDFDLDYCELVEKLNSSQEICCFRGSPTIKSYRAIYRKLCHFFDDFNFFINIALSSKITQSRYSKFGCSTNGLRAFILRIRDMNIPPHMKASIKGFLSAQLLKITEKEKQLRLEGFNKWMIETTERTKTAKEYPSENRTETLYQLTHIWEKFPELRLGQLISNSLPQGTDIFYVTDDKLIQLLQNFEVKHGLP